MTIALCATALVILALLSEITWPMIERRLDQRRARKEARRHGVPAPYDPGRERRAEQRARELLKSCVNEEEWAMYRDLGFIRVWGGQAGLPADAAATSAACRTPTWSTRTSRSSPTSRRPATLLNEYCVEFPDETKPYGSARLPDSDDVLAKWMALKGDERRLIAEANLHLPGRQIDPKQVQRDIWRLGRWERERLVAPRRPPILARPRRRRPGRTIPARSGCRLLAHRPAGPQAQLARAHRGPGAGRRPRLPEGHRLRRRGALEADHRRRPPWTETMPCNFNHRALAAKVKEGDPRGRRHADGVQHDRDLRRHHDGHQRA